MSLRDKQIRSIREYTGSYYQRFNSDLRDNLMPTTDENLINYINIWNFLDTNRTPADLNVYRGVYGGNQEAKDRFLRNLNIFYSGFISSSLDNRVALGFIGAANCCLINLRVPAGSRGFYVDPFSQFPGEQELLLAPGIIRQTTLLNPDGVCNAVYENFDKNYIVDELYQDVISEVNCENCRENGIQRPAVKYCHSCPGVRNQYCEDCFTYIHFTNPPSPDYNNHIAFSKQVVRNGTTNAQPVFAMRHKRKSRKTTKKSKRKSRKTTNKSKRKSRKTTNKSKRKSNRKSKRKSNRKSKRKSRKTTKKSKKM